LHRIAYTSRRIASLDKLADLFTRAGNAAQPVGDAADKITAALPTDAETKRARRAVRSWSAWSFASLLDRLFGR